MEREGLSQLILFQACIRRIFLSQDSLSRNRSTLGIADLLIEQNSLRAACEIITNLIDWMVSCWWCWYVQTMSGNKNTSTLSIRQYVKNKEKYNFLTIAVIVILVKNTHYQRYKIHHKRVLLQEYIWHWIFPISEALYEDVGGEWTMEIYGLEPTKN